MKFILKTIHLRLGFSGGSDDKESACNLGNLASIPGLGRSRKERNGLPTPVFLPGEFSWQRSLAGYSPWGCKESDMTEWWGREALQTCLPWLPTIPYYLSSLPFAPLPVFLVFQGEEWEDEAPRVHNWRRRSLSELFKGLLKCCVLGASCTFR